MRKLYYVLMITLVSLLVFCLAGCGGKTLEKCVADDPEIKAQLEKTLEDQSNDLMKYSVEFEENCMVVTGSLGIKTSEYDLATTGKTLEALSQQNADPQLEMIEELTGLSDVTVRYIILDSEGTELFNKEYGKSE